MLFLHWKTQALPGASPPGPPPGVFLPDPHHKDFDTVYKRFLINGAPT